MHRYFASLAYDGTNYFGWQIQPNDISIQQHLNEALSTVFRMKVDTTGCGRTDKGVHATQFYAHFDLEHEIASVEKSLLQLNALLPRDIRVFDLIAVAPTAHARFDAVSRSYSYYIKKKPSPFLNNYCWYNRQSVDVKAMNAASVMCLSHLNFSCFTKSGGNQQNHNCLVTECKWIENDSNLRFTVSANRFMRGMVRAMVGTFYEVGLGKISTDDFKKILESSNRTEAGKSVPAQGLFLEQIKYPYIQANRQYYYSL